MRAIEFLKEASSLDLQKVTKRPGRVDKFLDLIDQGHEFNSKHGPVVLDKEQIPYLQSVLKPENVGTGSSIKVTTIDGKTFPMGNIYFDQAAWGEFGKGGDPEIDVKASKVFKHQDPEKGQVLTADLAINLGAFPASELADRIKNNETIKNQLIGPAITQIVNEIDQGKIPKVPENLSKKALTSVINDAFEYIGILSLLKGVADFPNRDEFVDHVGSNISDMVLYFPKTANNPLTDSYALTGREGNSILISSKGRKGGAPSSIGSLKIPDAVAAKNNDTVKFLEYIKQTGTAWHQPFLAANFIHGLKTGKGKLGELEKFLPFTSETMTYIKSIWDNRRRGVPEKLEDIPEQFRPLFELVAKWAKDGKYALGFNIRNYVKDVIVLDAINNKNAIPSWNDTMLEVLGMNFVVIKTEVKNNEFITHVRWPSKMDGKINLAAKDPADKWDSAMTWKLD